MKVSIITINFNNLEGLKKTMQSVFNQTFHDFEFIVIDGGSSDGSAEYIFQNTAKLSYWVSEKDQGIYNAMNKGILKAKGEYCLFLNSGDWFVDNHVLENVFSLNPKENIVYGNILKVFSTAHVERDKGPQSSFLTLADMFSRTLPHQSVFIKRELFDKFGLYDEEFKIISDWAFFLKTIGLEGTSVKYIDIDISFYDTSGISSYNHELRFREKRAAFKKVVPAQIYHDYSLMQENEYKIVFYNRLVELKFLMILIRLFNRMFRLHLWRMN